MKLKLLALSTAWIAITHSATAQEAPAAEKPQEIAEKATVSAGQKITEIIALEQEKQKNLMLKVGAIANRKEARALFHKERSDPRPPALKILELAKASPKEKEVVAGLTWGLSSYKPEERRVAMSLILKHQLDSKDLGKILDNLSRKGSAYEGYLRDFMLFSNNEKVRQSAALYLAKNLLKDPKKKAEGLAISKQLMAWPGIKESNPKLFQAAKTTVFIANNLSIGCKVPDIVGKDQDDVEFKLSDYKGKVVLLDFWGIW